MKLSNAVITHVIERAEASWRHNKLPASRKENYLLTLKLYLSQGGTIENVCPACLGSGFKGEGNN